MSAPLPQDLAEHALTVSRSDHCVAIVRTRSSANLRWANNTLTTNGVSLGQEVTVIALRDTASGTASASMTGTATTLAHVTELTEAADARVRSAGPSDDAAPLVHGGAALDWHDPPATTSIETYEQFAPALGEAFGRAESAGRQLYGFVDHEMLTTYLASTAGLRLRHAQPTGHWGCTGKTQDLRHSAWVGGATVDFRDVDAAAMDEELERRLSWSSNAVTLPAGRYDTILPPTAVADLMIYAYWVAQGRAASDGQTVFSRPGGGTRIGESLTDRPVQLYSDPGYPGLHAAPFVVATASGESSSVFDNGLPLERTSWISDGTLTALTQTRETATATGEPTTPAIDNLILEVSGALGSPEDLVGDVERGLLLTCLWYIRPVDPQTLLLTGLTRDGVYLVEDGQITAEVNNFRFNESPVGLLGRFSGASATVPAFSREWGDYFPRTAMPGLRIPDFNMSTVSLAQ